jgi:1,2-diacylglycerol 3-beta-galactosyltransferase
MMERTHVVVIYTDAGGGHRAAAQALREILEGTGLYRVTLVNPYVELMAHLDLVRRLSGRTAEAFYNETILRDGHTGLVCWIYYMTVLLNFRLAAREGRRILGDYFERVRPDVVITDLPMLNRVIFNALADYRAGGGGRETASGVVLITDWTEIGRHIWFPAGGDYHAICGTEDSFRRASGVRGLTGRVHRTQGLLLKPSFLPGPPKDRAAARIALGLAPDRPVVCVLYGSAGSWRMRDLALSLIDTPPEAQFVFLCGRNDALADDLNARAWPFPLTALGFTQDVPKYLGVADIFVGKPGPGSVSEALANGLSLLLDRTLALPQEKPVLKWALRSKAGRTFARPAEFREALLDLLARRTGATEDPPPRPNTAALEIPGILEAIRRADGGWVAADTATAQG